MSFIPDESPLVVSSVAQDTISGGNESGRLLKAGDTLISISELKPVRTGKTMSEKKVYTIKLKTQVDKTKFLYRYKPGTKIEIKIFSPGYEKKKYKLQPTKLAVFMNILWDGLRNTYFNFTFNNAKADLITREFKQSYIQGFPDQTFKRIEEITNMDIWNEKDKEKIISKFSTYYKYDLGTKDYLGETLKEWNKENIKLLKKLLKPRF